MYRDTYSPAYSDGYRETRRDYARGRTYARVRETTNLQTTNRQLPSVAVAPNQSDLYDASPIWIGRSNA